MKNILVTGGAGFIGSNFIQYALTHDPNIYIVNLDALTYAGRIDNLRALDDSKRYVLYHGNICEEEIVNWIIKTNEIDTIINFAAETHVDRSIAKSDEFIQTNIVGTHTLLECVRNYGKQIRFHQVSTDEVYGSLGKYDSSWTESSPYKPNSPYAASKASADHLVRSYGHTYGLPYSISISSNNYGPRQFPEKLIPLMISNAVQGKPLPVYGDGQQVRDWLYVEDHCEAIWTILTKGKAGETYNVGGGNQIINLSMVKRICDLVGAPYSLITHVPDRLGHDRRYELNTVKITLALEWYPAHDLTTGLEETVAWYLANPMWLRRE